LYDQQKITVYFFECNEIEANQKINRYQKIFGKGAKPEWVKHIKNTKIGFSQQLENLLSDHTQLSLSAKKCREEEIISNDQLHIDIKEFTRKYPEKIKAIKNSKNKCALEILNRHCIYFERRNKIINIPNERYLEVHHLIPLSSTIPNSSFECLDKYENMVCLCGNCHNQIHYGMEKDVELILKNLYELKERELKKVGLNIGIKKLISIYKEL
jgi:5-methylcytosine-specific restriction endonuclease McrA